MIWSSGSHQLPVCGVGMGGKTGDGEGASTLDFTWQI